MELAEKLGARVIEAGWRGYAGQKNWAAEQATHDWILSLDADEALSEALEAEIWNVKKNGPRFDAYTMPLARPLPGALDPALGLASRQESAAVRSPEGEVGGGFRA